MSLDTDGNGTVEIQEYVNHTIQDGDQHMKDHMESMFAAMDVDRSGSVDIKELCKAIFLDVTKPVMADILFFMTLDTKKVRLLPPPTPPSDSSPVFVLRVDYVYILSTSALQLLVLLLSSFLATALPLLLLVCYCCHCTRPSDSVAM